jgi:hypothetical protein
LETLHLNEEVWEAFVHFDVIGLLIHQFKDDLILLLILLVQGLNSDLRESEDSGEAAFMIFVRICCLRILFLNDRLLRLLLLIIVIILASMLLVHLVLHELLGSTQLRSLRSLVPSLLEMLSVRLIGYTQVRLSSTSNNRVLARLPRIEGTAALSLLLTPLFELVEKIFCVSILPLALLMLLGQPHAQVMEGLLLLILLLFVAHLVEDHGFHQRCVLAHG